MHSLVYKNKQPTFCLWKVRGMTSRSIETREEWHILDTYLSRRTGKILINRGEEKSNDFLNLPPCGLNWTGWADLYTFILLIFRLNTAGSERRQRNSYSAWVCTLATVAIQVACWGQSQSCQRGGKYSESLTRQGLEAAKRRSYFRYTTQDKYRICGTNGERMWSLHTSSASGKAE